jgi:3-oxoacyl-[acyl-carrier-protein] synthase II
MRVYSLSRAGDAYHMTAPPPDGSGATLAMRRAIAHAQLTPRDVRYVNAHATSTVLGKFVFFFTRIIAVILRC